MSDKKFVTFQALVESRVRFTELAALSALIAPVLRSTARISLHEFRFTSFASGSQEIGDFLGVAM